MPEGPEIRIIAEELNNRCRGMYFDILSVNCLSRYYDEPLFRSDVQLVDMRYTTISKCRKVSSRGKKIIFHLGDTLFISSCLMYGRWTFEQTENSSMCMKFIKNDKEEYIFYEDPTKDSLFSIVNKDSKNHRHILKDVGIEYMSNDFNYKVFKKTVRNKNKIRICDFLLNQRYFSGIGNYLKSEILYDAKINPFRKIEELSRDEIKILYESILSVMNEAYENGGLSFSSYRSPSGKIGKYKCRVYMRQTDDFGNFVSMNRDGRVTYWVEEIQK